MRELTDQQKTLVERYTDYDLEDLYNEIGNTIAKSSNNELIQRYVLGTPNVHDRGARVVADVRAAICAEHKRIEKIILDNQAVLDPIDWAATIGDVILALTLTAGIPPWSVACALGKLCNYSLSKMCPKGTTENASKPD
jgi:hypothetical protein